MGHPVKARPPVAGGATSSGGAAGGPKPLGCPPWLIKPKGLDQQAYRVWFTRKSAFLRYTPPSILHEPVLVADWWQSPEAPSDTEVVHGTVGLLDVILHGAAEIEDGAEPTAARPASGSPAPVRFIVCTAMCAQCTNQCERAEKHHGPHDCEQHADYSD
jgi:hypothetical protein